MFAKKQSSYELTSMSQPFKQLSLNSTHLNHEFFLLVRDQRYEEAYALGQKILKDTPDNTAVANFCDFIKNNSKGLSEMIEDQDYTDGSDEQGDEEDDDEQDDEDDEEQENQPSSRSASSSISSKISSVKSKPLTDKKIVSSKQVDKKQLNKENAHQWEHNCKNPNCPNKNKPHKH